MEIEKIKQNDYKHKLFPEQTDTVLKNWWRMLGIKKVKCIFNGKPNFSEYNVNKFRISNYRRFANKYTVFHCEGNEYGDLFFIIVDTNHFDKTEICICSWFDHMFEPYIVPGNYTRPQIFICTLSELSPNNYTKIPQYLFIGPYRIVSLWDMYYIIGSLTGRIGYTYDYKLLTDLPLEYNGRDYTGITDYDPMCKIMNAIVGDVIEYKRVMNECSPYAEIIRRRVIINPSVTNCNSGCFQGGADPDFYREYEIDVNNRLVNRPEYKGPTNAKNMSSWPKLTPKLTKHECYELIKRTDPDKYQAMLIEDKEAAENYESLKKTSKRHNIQVITRKDIDDEEDDNDNDDNNEDNNNEEPEIESSSSSSSDEEFNNDDEDEIADEIDDE